MIFMILGAPCGATTFLLLGLGFRVEVYVLCFRFEGCLVKNIAFLKHIVGGICKPRQRKVVVEKHISQTLMPQTAISQTIRIMENLCQSCFGLVFLSFLQGFL